MSTKPTIENKRISLINPTAREVARVAKSFRTMFQVRPVILVRGMFRQDAVKDGAERDVSLNLTNYSARVYLVGVTYLTVDLGPGLGVEQVIPDKGTNVDVSLKLPEPGDEVDHG